MPTYSDAEFQRLMADMESNLIERKESAADGRKIRRNICAFANDLPGNGRPGVMLERKSLHRLIRNLSPHGEVLSLCYEAGPCGYGLYREIIETGHLCELELPLDDQ